VRLSDEVLEDSIERGELRQTMMEMIADAISRDMEEVLVSGDTASADPFLATMDGVLKQATSHVVDAAAAPISKDLLRDLVKTLPSEYLRDKSAMRYLTSVDADLDYRNTLAERATAVGDKFLEGDAPVLYSGVPVQPIPLFPENLGAGERPDGHPALQPEEHPRRHLAADPHRVGARHLRGHAEDRRDAPLRREVRRGDRRGQGHQRAALS
jgi:hypothetical protein